MLVMPRSLSGAGTVRAPMIIGFAGRGYLVGRRRRG
jgi:hypothetical protein